jgi:predicted transcriptional regulator
LQILALPGATEIRRSWEDGDGTRIEDELGEIVAELIVAGEVQYRELVQRNYQWRVEWKAELEEEERRRKEEEDRLKRERQVKAQRERLERLFNEASALRKAGEIRAYVEAVREASALARSPLPQERLQNWIAWALGEADRIDPIRSGRFIGDVKDGQDS